MKRKIDISLLFFLVFSAVICVESYKLEIGSVRSPKSGLFPFIMGMLLGLLSGCKLLLNFFAAHDVYGSTTTIPMKRITPVIGSLLVYLFLMSEIGFVLSTILLIIFLLKVIESKPWWVAMTMAFGGTFVTHVVFKMWLKIQLPEGFIGF